MCHLSACVKADGARFECRLQPSDERLKFDV